MHIMQNMTILCVIITHTNVHTRQISEYNKKQNKLLAQKKRERKKEHRE